MAQQQQQHEQQQQQQQQQNLHHHLHNHTPPPSLNPHLFVLPPRYPSSPSSTASSESDQDAPGPDDPPRRGDDRNLRIHSNLLHHPIAPALATPSSKIGSHPWPFNSLSPRLHSNLSITHPQSLSTPTHSAIPTTSLHLNSQSNRLPQLSLSSSLPHEILIQILRSVSSANDLRRALLVCKAWCQCGIELLWHKPTFPSTSCLIKMLVSLASKNQTFPYISFIRRLNFSGIADHMTDHILLRLVNCTRLERLTLSGCNSITDDSIIKILKNSQDLVALDLSDCKLITDECIHAIGQFSKSLQGLNLSGCKALTDVGLQSLRHSKALRRLKLKFCEKITDAALIAVASACPLLLEIDLVGCKLISNATLWVLWKHSSHLRELILSGCTEISDGGFPSSLNFNMGADGLSPPILEHVTDLPIQNDTTIPNGNSHQLESSNDQSNQLALQHESSAQSYLPSLPSHRRLEGSIMHFDHIRFLDLTSLTKLTDSSLDGIIKHMPRIRNLVLAKCLGLTDEALNSVCGLGKYLHYLHLGHVSSLTDRAVIRVARSCTRLRYIDLACCNNLTDMSVFELAQCLPRLKRIGLVRVSNITDQSVYALVERTSLERIHLSYCDNITVGAIHWLLQRLHRLTHLSLTGVPAFRRTDLQAWCRAPPKDFNAHQRQAFCVYSGKGVNELRYYLAALYISITNHVTRGRVGQPPSSNNSSLDGDSTNHLPISAAAIGPNLAVFNSMPDPRMMAAAMAAARQQTNPQLYGLGNRRREVRITDRSGRMVLSDLLHQGTSGGVVSAIIATNGQLLTNSDPLWNHSSRIRPHVNGDSNMEQNGMLSIAQSSNRATLDVRNNDNVQSTPSRELHREGGTTNSNGLRSPAPLYGVVPNTRRSPYVTTPERETASIDDQPTRNGTSFRVGTEQETEEAYEQLPQQHSIIRRRSDVEMSLNGSVNPTSHHRRNLDVVDSELSATNLNTNGLGMVSRTRSNDLDIDHLPDRPDTASPIDISDDERPPP